VEAEATVTRIAETHAVTASRTEQCGQSQRAREEPSQASNGKAPVAPGVAPTSTVCRCDRSLHRHTTPCKHESASQQPPDGAADSALGACKASERATQKVKTRDSPLPRSRRRARAAAAPVRALAAEVDGPVRAALRRNHLSEAKAAGK
jgi:hypothetical protein